MSLRLISSKLCSVARATVEPASSTGLSSATGVITPVRPTWKVTPSSVVTAFSAEYL
jgi:hypothetical protein